MDSLVDEIIQNEMSQLSDQSERFDNIVDSLIAENDPELQQALRDYRDELKKVWMLMVAEILLDEQLPDEQKTYSGILPIQRVKSTTAVIYDRMKMLDRLLDGDKKLFK